MCRILNLITNYKQGDSPSKPISSHTHILQSMQTLDNNVGHINTINVTGNEECK